jgi:hypothetical protein
MEVSKCLQCNQPLTGRSDKKFCDAYCRNQYNNQVKRRDEQLILKINQRIRKNRRILKTLCPQGKAMVRREVMTHMGYDFNFFSSIYRSSSGQLYFMCYEYGFAAVIERKIEKGLIIQSQNYHVNYTVDPWKLLKSKA